MKTYNNTPIKSTEANLVKSELMKAIKRQFKKHSKDTFFSEIDLRDIYTDCMAKYLEVMPDNLAKETYLTNYLLND